VNDFFITFNYTPKPPLLAAEPNNFLQAEKPPKNGLAEKRNRRNLFFGYPPQKFQFEYALR